MAIHNRRTSMVGKALFSCLFVLSLVFTLFPQSSASAAGANNPDFLAYASAGIQALQGWYSSSNGLWNSQWWNSANELGAIIDYTRLTGNTDYSGDIATTFNDNAGGNFLNNYYDDEGWWALTWVNAYDYTGNTTYLNMAKTIFSDMTGGWDSTCGGGIWWSKDRTYKNAIPNELFLTLAARLHERTPGDSSYLNWANQEWTWFSGSGMINSSNLINDGLTSSCQNNGATTWTYNQGVILGGLSDMYKITGNTAYLTKAEAIANAALRTLVNANGILEEPCEPSASCNGDSSQFKGIFMRNLAYLYQVDHQQTYANFIVANANSIWQNDRNSSSQFGVKWYGPFDSADPVRQSSAQDALNSAISFSNAAGAGPGNVALGKSATANGSCTSYETPAKAVDGSITNDNKWCAGATNGQYWLQIDLGASFDIVSFTLFHAGAGGENALWNTQAFSIQISNDASSWRTVVSVANNTADITTHPIETVRARYIKLVITAAQTDPQTVAARIYELQAYAFPGGSSVDLAWNRPATANGSCSSSETPDKAVDRNIVDDSKWCAGATNGQYWLQIDLETSLPVGRIVLYHAGAGGENPQWDTNSFTLQTSIDGTSWNTVASVSGNTSDVTTSMFNTTQARYVQLTITVAQSNNQYIAARIYELEVFSS